MRKRARSHANDPAVAEAAATPSPSLRVVTPASSSGLQVADCIATDHPTLSGRVQVRLEAGHRWVAVLRGVVVRVGDRLLLAQPDGFDGPLVVGVVDGFERRAAPPKRSAATLTLRADEALTIENDEGELLFELVATESGVALRTHQPDLTLAVEGRLRLEGRELELRAKQGEAQIEASDDVVIRGENIHLN